MSAAILFRSVAALAVTLGVLALVLHLVRRLSPGLALGGRGLALRVLRRLDLGPRHRIALLQVGERVLLVGLGEGGVRLIAELDGEARSSALEASRPAPAPRRGLLALARAALLGALLLAPLPLHAQTAAGTSAPTAAAAAASRPIVTGAPAPAASRSASHPAGAIAPGPIPVRAPLAPHVDIRFGREGETLQLQGAVGLVVFLGFLTLLPAIVLLMTSFTRTLIVLHFLRSALGTPNAPPGQLLTALSLLLTLVVMQPVIQDVHRDALQPYLEGKVTQNEAYLRGVQPFRTFMLENTREADLALFADASGVANDVPPESYPLPALVCAFTTSELRTAFQMGFVLYLPFVVVDVIVASVLMSLGMFMLPPAMISLPFKLLLFVLADGWTLVVESLLKSFR